MTLALYDEPFVVALAPNHPWTRKKSIKAAVAERNDAAVRELDEQIEESREHAERFQATLDKAARRFAALAKVEEKHAQHYRATLARVQA